MKELTNTPEDLKELKQVLLHPEIFPYTTDDTFNDPEEYPIETFLENPNIVKCIQSDDKTAIFIFTRHNGIMWEVHTNILPEGRGKTAIENAENAAIYMFHKYPEHCKKIITFIPEYNIRAKALAHNIMNPEGVLSKSFQKNGKLFDLYVYGLNQEGVI